MQICPRLAPRERLYVPGPFLPRPSPPAGQENSALLGVGADYALLQERNDLTMFLLSQGNLAGEYDEGQDDHREGYVERGGLESLNVGGRQQVRVDVVSHSSGDGDETDDGVGQSTRNLVEHGSHREGNSLVALASLPLAILDRVRDRDDRGHLDAGGGQVEENQGDENDREVRGEEDEQDVGDSHEHHAAEVEVAARQAAVDDRVQGRDNQADDEGDDADNRVVVRLFEHELEEVDHEARGRDVGDGVQHVGQGHPHKLPYTQMKTILNRPKTLPNIF